MHGPRGLRGGANDGGRAGWCGQLCPSALSRPRHPLHTPAPISGCEPRLPCDRPSSGEGMGVHPPPSLDVSGLLPSPRPWRAGQARAAPPAPAWRLRPGQRGRPARCGEQTSLRPSWQRAQEDGRPCQAAPTVTSSLTPSPAARMPTSLQSPPATPSPDFGATVPKGPPSFLHSPRQ